MERCPRPAKLSRQQIAFVEHWGCIAEVGSSAEPQAHPVQLDAGFCSGPIACFGSLVVRLALPAPVVAGTELEIESLVVDGELSYSALWSWSDSVLPLGVFVVYWVVMVVAAEILAVLEGAVTAGLC